MANVSRKLLNKIVRRIVKVAKPGKIIMFGSAARDEMGPHSDVDRIRGASAKVGNEDPRKLGWRRLPGRRSRRSPEDIKRYGNCPALIIEPALREGKLLNAALAPPFRYRLRSRK